MGYFSKCLFNNYEKDLYRLNRPKSNNNNKKDQKILRKKMNLLEQ